MNIALSVAHPVNFSIEILQCLTAIFAESLFVRVADPLVLVTNARVASVPIARDLMTIHAVRSAS